MTNSLDRLGRAISRLPRRIAHPHADGPTPEGSAHRELDEDKAVRTLERERWRHDRDLSRHHHGVWG